MFFVFTLQNQAIARYSIKIISWVEDLRKCLTADGREGAIGSLQQEQTLGASGEGVLAAQWNYPLVVRDLWDHACPQTVYFLCQRVGLVGDPLFLRMSICGAPKEIAKP